MKKSLLSMTTLFALTMGINAQNTSPYWSLAGNSNASTSSKLGTTNAVNLRFFTSNTEKARITTSGNVGIGTTNPLTKLHVNGSGSFGNSITTANATRALNLADVNAVIRVLRVHATNAPAVELISRTSADGPNVAYWDCYAQPSDASFRIRDRQRGGSGLDRLSILHTNGNVGIGTNTPGYKLHVNGNALINDGLHVVLGGGEVSIIDADAAIVAESTGDLGVGIDASGQLAGVMGSSPSSCCGIGVQGTGETGVYGLNTGSMGGAGVTGASDNAIAVNGISTNGTGGDFQSVHSVGLRAQGGPGQYAGDFTGDVHTTGMFITSDARLKKNIKEFNNAMDIINRLQPKNYDFKNNNNYTAMNLPQGNHYGLLAQDLEKVLPNLVKESAQKFNDINLPHLNAANSGKIKPQITAQQETKENIKFKAVNYIELIPLIIKGMQELNAQKDKLIEALQSRVTDLQSQVDEIKLLISKGANNTSLTSATLTGYLKQNVPNPAGNNTIISYYLSQNAGKAEIRITDEKGSALKVYNATKGEGQLNIRSGDLPSGTYHYTLYVNDKKIDSKQMVITR